MLSQMGSMAGQLPQQIGRMFEAGATAAQSAAAAAQPAFAAVHVDVRSSRGRRRAPAGRCRFFVVFQPSPGRRIGPGGGGGMVSAASRLARAALRAQTPLMAKMVGSFPAGVAPPEGAIASSTAVGGIAPVAAGGAGMGGMGGMGMMGPRGASGGTRLGSACRRRSNTTSMRTSTMIGEPAAQEVLGCD